MLHVDGQDFEVKLTPEAIEPGYIMGRTSETTNVIAIDGTLPKSRQDEVMLHEMVHLASWVMPEDMVHDVGIRLYGMLREHGLLEEGELIDAMVSGTMSAEEMAVLNKDVQGQFAARKATRVSEVAWDGDQGRFTDEQWRQSCLINPDDSKGVSKLPVREPNGAVSRNACHVAATALVRGIGAVPFKVRAAARTLIRIYGDDLKEEPPQGLQDLAGD